MANSQKLDEGEKGVSFSGGDVAACAGLLPSFPEARELVQAPYSCLVLDTRRRHVVLPPVYLKKKRTGIQQELSSELLKYSNSLKGVPLAYDHIRVLGHHGDIFDDQGYIHLNIEASFVIFKPEKGKKLVGVINKIAVGHVGCLVHGCFNACVLKPAQLSPEQWRDSGLKVGSELEFEVLQLDADVAGVLLIRGRLEKSRVQELVASFSSSGPEEQSESLAAQLSTEPDSVNEDTGALKRKKKTDKKLDKEAMEDANGNQTTESHDATETEGNNASSNEMELHPNTSSEPEVKKKKKKKKDKRLEENDQEPSATDLLNSDSSGYLSDKNSKKRKARDSEGLHEDPDMTVAKKKKKVWLRMERVQNVRKVKER